MFEDEDLKPLLQSGQVPTKPQLMRFIKKNPLPSGKTWLDLKYKFKTKIDNNKAKEDNKKNIVGTRWMNPNTTEFIKISHVCSRDFETKFLQLLKRSIF